MKIRKAVITRIYNLCKERNITPHYLATISGVPKTTLYSILDEKDKKSQNPGVATIKKLCDGLEITIIEFFDDELFYNLEQEIS